MVKIPPANAGDTRATGLMPGWGRSPGGGNGNPLQYSCLENATDRGAWGFKELDTTEHTHTHTHTLYQYCFINYDKCTTVMYDANNRDNCLWVI